MILVHLFFDKKAVLNRECCVFLSNVAIHTIIYAHNQTYFLYILPVSQPRIASLKC